MTVTEKDQILNSVIESIQKREEIDNLKSLGYDAITHIINDDFMKDLSLVEKMDMCKSITVECQKQINLILKKEKERKNKKFRELPHETMRKRIEGERGHFPKSFRYWYYYGENESFMGWFHKRLDETYIASDISMLACTIRDQYKKGLIKETCIEAMEMLVRIEQKYNLDILHDVKGIDFLVTEKD